MSRWWTVVVPCHRHTKVGKCEDTLTEFDSVNSDNKYWAYICLKGFFGGLIFEVAYYWKEFCVSKWFGLDNKTRR